MGNKAKKNKHKNAMKAEKKEETYTKPCAVCGKENAGKYKFICCPSKHYCAIDCFKKHKNDPEIVEHQKEKLAKEKEAKLKREQDEEYKQEKKTVAPQLSKLQQKWSRLTNRAITEENPRDMLSSYW